MNKYKKKYVENLLRHLIYRTVTTLDNVYTSKNALKEKNMPLWIEEPVKEIFDELASDLSESLEPMINIVAKEYESRPDRAQLIKQINDHLVAKKVSQSGYEPCHCAGCEENREILNVDFERRNRSLKQ